ncbi:MAG: hypothetical protein WCD44_01300 [Candidatus Babeliales bacterium]
MKKFISYSKWMQVVGWLISIKLASFFKVSFIVGSQVAHFSAISIATPLVGLISGLSGCGIFFMLKAMLSFLFNPVSSLHLLAYCIPGFCASLYLASSHITIRFILPIICMILFIVHPVGFGAFTYALYWLIPIILYFVKRKSLFLQALGSTFVAHAVGSVIWLYTVPMSSVLWLGLIPVVIVERLFFASSIALTYSILSSLKNRIKMIKRISTREATPIFTFQ